jgi:oligoendopeptidase F
VSASTGTGDLPVWDLRDLFDGPQDPRIAERLDIARAMAAQLRGTFQGRLAAARCDPPALGAMIDAAVGLYQEMTDELWALDGYASLAASIARDDPAASRFEADMQAKVSAIAGEALFLSLEINGLEDGEIAAALDAVPAATRWRPWLRRVRLSRPHDLAPDMERLLIDRAPAVANWVRLYDRTLATLDLVVDGERTSLAQALGRLSDPQPQRRRAAAHGLGAGLCAAQEILALCLNTVVVEKGIEDRWRRFPDAAAARHLSNEVDAQAVEALEGAVTSAHASLSHRYYRLKARALGRERLHHWDRNAPLDEAPQRTYAWSEARDLVLSAFADLSPRLGDAAAVFFQRPWIDARPRAGKQSGAYSHPMTAPRHPWIFLNYMGERRDVLSLAHELGHAVHQTLAAPNGALSAATPLTLAETASLFAEGVVFERLLAQASAQERRGLLAGRIEDALNTVVRQMAFHRFERRVHAQRRQGELSPQAIGAAWLEVMGESLGPAVTLDAGFETWWAHISHFVHSPFYVYAYAFGRLLVEALMVVRARDPEAFVPLYESLLAGGGARTYVEALAPFGLDPREAAFWRLGLGRLEAMVDDFEALAQT